MTDATDVALEKAARAVNANDLRPFDWDATPVNYSGKIICRCVARAAIEAYQAALPKGELAKELLEAAEFYDERPSIDQEKRIPSLEEISDRECKDLSRILRAAASLLGGGVPEGWRDISTAPKDGTAIDVWLGHSEFPRRATEIRWRKPTDSEFWAGGSDDPDPKEGTFGSEAQWFDDVCGPYQGDEAPTHWMPLPRPPESGRE